MRPVERVLPLLRCPVDRAPLRLDGDALVSTAGRRYAVTPSGIPLFAEASMSEAGASQQRLYDGMTDQYVDNLDAPHTAEYDRLFRRLLKERIRERPRTLLELCCGRGEAFLDEALDFELGIGLDVSRAMLEAGRPRLPDRVALVQADVTRAPLADGSVDTIVALGGVHHVPDRGALFAEVARLLAPGGWFYWREPADDFLPWRVARKIIYRLSPELDDAVERPLRHDETRAALARAGLSLESWRTCGFIGFALFMNSDVLKVNRGLRHVPGVRALTRAFVALDEACVRLPGLRRAGAQVVGAARKAD